MYQILWPQIPVVAIVEASVFECLATGQMVNHGKLIGVFVGPFGGPDLQLPCGTPCKRCVGHLAKQHLIPASDKHESTAVTRELRKSSNADAHGRPSSMTEAASFFVVCRPPMWAGGWWWR